MAITSKNGFLEVSGTVTFVGEETGVVFVSLAENELDIDHAYVRSGGFKNPKQIIEEWDCVTGLISRAAVRRKDPNLDLTNVEVCSR